MRMVSIVRGIPKKEISLAEIAYNSSAIYYILVDQYVG